jgi:hypothetical protein
MKNLLSVSIDAKTIKGQKYGYLTGILYLAPAEVSGFNTCPMASDICKKVCIYTTGRGRFTNVQQARINKTISYFNEREKFIQTLDKDISKLKTKAKKLGLVAAVRLNGTSDLLGNDYLDLIRKHSEIKFYDYTKVSKRFNMNLPNNYSLTFSRSESNESEALRLLEQGNNVAVVFQTRENDELPILWNGFPVINGDESDLRFLDAKGVVVGLKAKGSAKKDLSGFVVLSDAKESIYFDDIKKTA